MTYCESCGQASPLRNASTCLRCALLESRDGWTTVQANVPKPPKRIKRTFRVRSTREVRA